MVASSSDLNTDQSGAQNQKTLYNLDSQLEATNHWKKENFKFERILLDYNQGMQELGLFDEGNNEISNNDSEVSVLTQLMKDHAPTFIYDSKDEAGPGNLEEYIKDLYRELRVELGKLCEKDRSKLQEKLNVFYKEMMKDGGEKERVIDALYRLYTEPNYDPVIANTDSPLDNKFFDLLSNARKAHSSDPFKLGNESDALKGDLSIRQNKRLPQVYVNACPDLANNRLILQYRVFHPLNDQIRIVKSVVNPLLTLLRGLAYLAVCALFPITVPLILLNVINPRTWLKPALGYHLGDWEGVDVFLKKDAQGNFTQEGTYFLGHATYNLYKKGSDSCDVHMMYGGHAARPYTAVSDQLFDSSDGRGVKYTVNPTEGDGHRGLEVIPASLHNFNKQRVEDKLLEEALSESEGDLDVGLTEEDRLKNKQIVDELLREADLENEQAEAPHASEPVKSLCYLAGIQKHGPKGSPTTPLLQRTTAFTGAQWHQLREKNWLAKGCWGRLWNSRYKEVPENNNQEISVEAASANQA